MRDALRWALAAVVLSAPVAARAQDLSAPLAERFNQGVVALQAGQLDAAESAFRAVLQGGGARAFVHHNLGIVLQQRAQHASALVEFRAASRLDPTFGPARLLAGASLIALGQIDAALAELRHAVALMPAEPAAHLQLADACERAGDYICLVDRYRALATLAPANVEYAYRLGKAYLRLSQWAHERMREVDPDGARVNQARARELLEQQRPDLAESAFAAALQRDPSLHEARLALARLYAADGRLTEASREISRVLSDSPMHREALELKTKLGL